MVDLSSIRRAAQDGLPVEQVLALCDEAERWRRQASLWADNIDALTRRHDRLLAVARAWANAVERQDIAEIERRERELIIAIAACS